MTWDRSSTLTSWRPIWLQASSHWWRPHNLEFQRPLLLRRTRRTSLQRGSPHLLGILSRLPIKVSHCPMRMQEAHRAMFTTSPASVWKYAQRRFHGLWFIVQRNWRCFSLIYQALRFKNSCRPYARETWAPAGFLFDLLRSLPTDAPPCILTTSPILTTQPLLSSKDRITVDTCFMPEETTARTALRPVDEDGSVAEFRDQHGLASTVGIYV
ncbi:hypothetical protein B0H10DRAFT_2112442, partial [Mycena sp. CBHHK59/15]